MILGKVVTQKVQDTKQKMASIKHAAEEHLKKFESKYSESQSLIEQAGKILIEQITDAIKSHLDFNT
jgi:ElaB/YqjD/DUF883 family membrane-anchored ribosome-binding protein